MDSAFSDYVHNKKEVEKEPQRANSTDISVIDSDNPFADETPQS